jgi:hypothetical protein
LSPRIAAWIAWALGVLYVVLLAFALLLFAFNRSHPSVDVYGPWIQETIVAVTFPALGLLSAAPPVPACAVERGEPKRQAATCRAPRAGLALAPAERCKL